METQDLKQTIARELEVLARLRDDLKVRMHLAKNELRDEWNKLDPQWLRMQDELKRVAAEGKGTAQKASRATLELIENLKGSYERLKTQLNQSK